MTENDRVPPDSADEVNAAHAALVELGVPMFLEGEHPPLPRPDRRAGPGQANGPAAGDAGRGAVLWRLAAAALVAALPLMACTDTLTAKCPPLAHPPVLTVAAASDPCQAKAGESAGLLALRVVKTYQRSSPPVPGAPTRYPLRCGTNDYGYLHLLDERAHGNYDHGDPENDPKFDAEIAYTIEHGSVVVQNNNNLRVTVRYDDAQKTCHSNRWGFRVILATNAPTFPPPTWRPDGLPTGVITAFRLPTQPSS